VCVCVHSCVCKEIGAHLQYGALVGLYSQLLLSQLCTHILGKVSVKTRRRRRATETRQGILTDTMKCMPSGLRAWGKAYVLGGRAQVWPVKPQILADAHLFA